MSAEVIVLPAVQGRPESTTCRHCGRVRVPVRHMLRPCGHQHLTVVPMLALEHGFAALACPQHDGEPVGDCDAFRAATL